MANKIGDIARGNLNQNINQQALKQFVGPAQGTPTDASLTGQNAQTALAALQKSQQQSGVPNPTVSTSGGAMAQDANGISSGGGNVMNQTQQVPSSNGMEGIRARFNNAGIGNDAIGWDGKNVTVNGKAYITPQSVEDGTSYSSEQDINKAIDQYYADSGKPLSQVTNYVAAQGIGNAVKWSDGQLSIGGQQVPIVRVDKDGTAYAHQSDLDNAITAYKKSAGITGNQEVYQNWQDTYGNDIRNALKAITDRKEWSYDMESDPAYQSYRDQYIREGNRAYQDAYGQMAANTGGYGSSAAMNAAGQQMNYYMQQLNDRVPELMQNDYNRYLGEQQLRRQALDSIMGVADSDYNKQYQANRDAINDTNTANYYSYLRDKDARDYNRDVLESDRTWPYQEALLKDQTTQSGIDTSRYAENADLGIAAKQIANESGELANWAQRFQKMLTSYSYGDLDTPISATDAAAVGVSPKANGTYPTIREMQESYATLQAMLESKMWTEAERQQLIDTWKINNGLYGI